MSHLPFRQVHLDFHTSQHIPGVGAKFDVKEFANTLEKARVNSCTCFARCHHGLMYFDSKAHPERIHPNLHNKNMLVEQINELHKRGIRVPVYTTVQWDEYTSENHPEWHVIGENGEMTAGLYDATFRRTLCVNSPYRAFLKEHIKDMFSAFPLDGLFLDIVKAVDCSCRWCRAGMKEQGLDASNKSDRMAYAIEMMKGFKEDLSAFIREHNEECEIFYNQGHISPDTRESLHNYNHLEVESLPSGEWGYGHFPTVVRYARTLGADFMGMTGKFHTSWADMHSFKNQAALEYEIFHMIAMNGKCSIGDQLHPHGQISEDTYDLIGSVYSSVEKKEPWCAGAKALTDIGVINPEEFRLTIEHSDQAKVLQGVTRLLAEAGHQFDIIDTKARFEDYKLLILADEIEASPEFAERLEQFTAQGGKILASHKAGLNPEGTAFASDLFGVKLVGEAPFSPDFIVPEGMIGQGLRKTEHVMYQKGLQVEALEGSEVLCETMVPYFNRTWEHYCSHMHTPSAEKVGYPGVVQNGNVIYFMHPVFNQYVQNAPLWVKRMVLNAIEGLLPQPTLRHNGPSSVIAAVNEQAEESRAVAHLLHYIPESKSDDTLIIEDIIPLHELKVSLKLDKEVTKVTCVPEMKELEFSTVDNRLEFVLPKLHGHQMIELQYA